MLLKVFNNKFVVKIIVASFLIGFEDVAIYYYLHKIYKYSGSGYCITVEQQNNIER